MCYIPKLLGHINFANKIINLNDMRAEKHMTGWNAITDAFLKLYPKQTIVYLTVSVIPF